MGSRLHLGRVRLSDAEVLLYDKCAGDLSITRSVWVRAALDYLSQKPVTENDIDIASAALSRMKRSGGLNRNLASVLVHQALLDTCDDMALKYELSGRSEWIRSALYLCATQYTLTVKKVNTGLGKPQA